MLGFPAEKSNSDKPTQHTAAQHVPDWSRCLSITPASTSRPPLTMSRIAHTVLWAWRDHTAAQLSVPSQQTQLEPDFLSCKVTSLMYSLILFMCFPLTGKSSLYLHDLLALARTELTTLLIKNESGHSNRSSFFMLN